MKIDGIDPLLLNRIKEQTDRLEVQKSETVFPDNRTKRESGRYKGQAAKPIEPDYNKRVEQALRQLNQRAEEDNLDVRFNLRKEKNYWHIEVFDRGSSEVIRAIPTDRAFEVLSRIQGLFGLMLDEKR